MDPLFRKRNASDGDSGFDSALSSRSSSISLEDQEEDFDKLSPAEFEKYLSSPHHRPVNDLSKSFILPPHVRDLVGNDEVVEPEGDSKKLFNIVNKVTGQATLYKPPSRLKFSSVSPQVFTVLSSEEYNRCDIIPRSQLFQARLEFELEKQLEQMEMVEIDLNMAAGQDAKHPPSLGIRVIGVNMIHGVSDKLNIYIKRVLEDSVAGHDGRIRVNDQIVEVNGVSLVGVSQKVAATTLSNCSVLPDTGSVHFVLARPPPTSKTTSEEAVEGPEDDGRGGGRPAVDDQSESVMAKIVPVDKTKIEQLIDRQTSIDGVASEPSGAVGGDAGRRSFASEVGPAFEGRSAVRLKKCFENVKSVVRGRKESVIFGSVVFVATLLLMIPNRGKPLL